MQPDSIDNRLEEVSRNWDLLKHPFYQRWISGDLTRAELAYYAGQYAHVVRAIPRWLDACAAQDEKNAARLKLHAAEEFDHIAMWETFAAALGIEQPALQGSSPNAATAALLASCDELVKAGYGTAVVWSLEAQSPAVSAEKLRGLRAHYGIDAETGAQYFAVHQELDRDHEAHLRRVIHDQDAAMQGVAPAVAETTLRGMWDLLTASQAA